MAEVVPYRIGVTGVDFLILMTEVTVDNLEKGCTTFAIVLQAHCDVVHAADSTQGGDHVPYALCQ